MAARRSICSLRRVCVVWLFAGLRTRPTFAIWTRPPPGKSRVHTGPTEPHVIRELGVRTGTGLRKMYRTRPVRSGPHATCQLGVRTEIGPRKQVLNRTGPHATPELGVRTGTRPHRKVTAPDWIRACGPVRSGMAVRSHAQP